MQARSQGLSVEDAAAGVARPAKPKRADGGRRFSCGCHHTGYQNSPSGGSSSARLGRPSNVRAGRIIGVIGVARGGKTTPIEGGLRIGLGERGLDEGPASNRLSALAILAALGGPPGGRSTRPPRHRGSSSDSAGHRGTSEKRCSGGTSGGSSRSRSLSRSRDGHKGSSSCSHGLSGGMSCVRISLGSLNISRKDPSVNNAAQDSRSRGSLSRLIDGTTESSARRGRGSANPGIDLGCSIRHVGIGADCSLGLGRGGSEGRGKSKPPLRRALTLPPARTRRGMHRRRTGPISAPRGHPGAELMADGLGGVRGMPTRDHAAIAAVRYVRGDPWCWGLRQERGRQLQQGAWSSPPN